MVVWLLWHEAAKAGQYWLEVGAMAGRIPRRRGGNAERLIGRVALGKIDGVAENCSELVFVPSLHWLGRTTTPGFIRRNVYLLAGEPDLEKTAALIECAARNW